MQAGEIIADTYRLNEQLQSAWRASNIRDGSLCLLKPAGGFVDPGVADWLAAMWHPGVPRYLAKVTGTDQQEYYAFEYLPGKSLAQLADEQGGSLPLPVLLPLVTEIAGILAFLHQQGEQPLLHLDIKPRNLICSENHHAGLIDFGAAILLPDSGRHCPDLSRTPVRIAMTPDYAAPELLAGHPGPGSDLYALGLTLLVLMTGLPPAVCRSRPLADLLPATTTGLHRLLGRCLQTEPLSRYAQADELACDLASEWDLLQHGFDQPSLLLPDSAECADDGQKDRERLPAPLLCVWDGPDLGCELAAVLAEKREVLVVDANLLNPRADLLLGLRGPPRSLFAEKQMNGLDLVMSEEQKGHLNTAVLRRFTEQTHVRRVSVLASQSSLSHYEFFQMDSLHQVLRLARLICDLVVVLCSRMIYDAFTCLSLLAADQVLIPLAGDTGSFREINRSVDFLASRHNLRRERLNYVAFPYDSRTDLSWGTMDELCGGRLAGCISDRPGRRSMKSGAIPYAAALDRVNRREYQGLIGRIRLAEPPQAQRK